MDPMAPLVGNPAALQVRGALDDASTAARRALRELEDGWIGVGIGQPQAAQTPPHPPHAYPPPHPSQQRQHAPAPYAQPQAGGYPYRQQQQQQQQHVHPPMAGVQRSISPPRPPPAHALAPAERGGSPPPAFHDYASTGAHSAPASVNLANPPSHRAAGDSVAAALAGSSALQQGDEVVLVDAATVHRRCRDAGCPPPHRNIDAFCDGRRVGRLLTVSQDMAAIDFGHEILAVPFACVVGLRALRQMRKDLGRPDPSAHLVGQAPPLRAPSHAWSDASAAGQQQQLQQQGHPPRSVSRGTPLEPLEQNASFPRDHRPSPFRKPGAGAGRRPPSASPFARGGYGASGSVQGPPAAAQDLSIVAVSGAPGGHQEGELLPPPGGAVAMLARGGGGGGGGSNPMVAPQQEGPRQPPPRSTHLQQEKILHERQVSQLVKSLRLKNSALKRTEDELTTSRKEVYILKKQLDKAGLAACVTAQVVRGKTIYLSRVDTSVPVGTDISHHLDDSTTPIDPQEFHVERGYPRRPPAIPGGDEIPLGREGYCSLVVAPRRERPNGVTLYAHNATNDMQIDFCVKLGQDGVQGSANVLWSRNAPRSFTLRVFPGQTEAVVQLNQAWNRVYSVSFSYGPVTDVEFLRELAAARAGVVEAEAQDVRELARNAGTTSPGGTITGPAGAANGPTPSDTTEFLLDLCLEHGVMFVDQTFPPTSSSITTPDTATFSYPFSWMRPCMFLPSVRLFSDEHFNSRALQLGSLGDACFIDAVALLLDTGRGVQRGWLLKKILSPPLADAAVRQEQELGIYRVSLCTDGWWRWTVIDDYLPMENGLHFNLAFARSAVLEEIWVGILEKAYAKSLGAYHRLLSGHVDHVLEDLTGSPCSVLSWDDGAGVLWDRVIASLTPRPDGTSASDRQSLFFAARSNAVGAEPGGEPLEWNGAVVPGRLYKILDAVAFDAEGLKLVKVRNLWGDTSLWNGYLCPDAPYWRNPGFEHIRERCQAPSPAAQPQGGQAPDPAAAADDDPAFTLWLTWEEAQKFFSSIGVYYDPGGWWDLRFRTGFAATRPAHAFVFEVYHDTEAIVSVIQPLYHDPQHGAIMPGALRAEVLEHSGDGWEVVVETDPAYIREKTMHTPSFHFRAGCTYVVLVHQWAKEADEYLRERKDVVLRVGTQERHFGMLRVMSVTPEMSEALRYDRYPSFAPYESSDVVVEAQQDGVDCLSSTIMPAPADRAATRENPPGYIKTAPPHQANRLHGPAGPAGAAGLVGSPGVHSDDSSDAGGPLLSETQVLQAPLSPTAMTHGRTDPHRTASRLRLLTDASADLNLEDKHLLANLADSLDGGFLSMQDFLGRLYVPDRRV